MEVCRILAIALSLASTVSCVDTNFRLTVTEAGQPRETLVAVGPLVGREFFGERHDMPIRLVQSSDGNLLVYSIFDANDRLTHCDIVFDQLEVKAFISAVYQQSASGNTSTVTLASKKDPLVAIDEQRTACERFKWNGAQDLDERRSRRTKRFFIAPGTYWCGMGNKAPDSKQLGENSDADRCCMEHDGCPYFIPGISSRFGYYNWRTHTLSYCACDQKFHKCLKDASTMAAELVGQIFFNVVNRACFDLERDKVCAEYNWWGTCRKWKTGLVAHVQETPRF